MRIDRIHVDAFGPLANFDTGEEALGGLVVVVGPNEAGKSTLFSFLTTALYGFHPASRERNPHVPWGAEEASGRIRLALGGGGCVEVERRLRSSPMGKLTQGGVTKELRNQPLPWVEHVPRAVGAGAGLPMPVRPGCQHWRSVTRYRARQCYSQRNRRCNSTESCFCLRFCGRGDCRRRADSTRRNPGS